MPDQEQPPQASAFIAPAPEAGGDQNLVPINIEDEMRRSYLDYAMSVIVGRALPDIRDGLKPVHRRILYTMQQMGLRPTAPPASAPASSATSWASTTRTATAPSTTPWCAWRSLSPCATRWWMARATSARWMAIRRPPTGTPKPACRASPTALLEDLDKETVDFKPNYDDSEIEPEVLPTRVPNLLVNGSSGIAVGMATNIPPHNLTEIVNAAIYLIQHPDAPLAKLLGNRARARISPPAASSSAARASCEAYTTGRGQLKIRATRHHRDASARTASRSSSPRFPTRSTSRS